MKNKTPIILLCLCLVVAACAPKEGVRRPAKPAGYALFEKAEQEFSQSRYAEARSLYRQYVENHPGAEMVPEAKLKLGMIHAAQKKFDPAREMYVEVIARYPETPQAAAARIKILESYINQGHFQEALDYRRRMAEEQLEPETRLQADLLAGDACMALEQFRQAYKVFSEVYRSADPEARKKVKDRLLAAISRLSPEYIASERQRLEGNPPAGYLMYQQGLNFMSEDRAGDAFSVFRKFLDRHPEHPEIERVRKHLATLAAEASFEGNVLGCVLPLTGKYRKFGRQALRGIELALTRAYKDMDADPPFRILVRDSQSDPETGRRAVEELAEKRVAAIIGPIAAAREGSDAAQKLGVPVFPFTQNSDIAENRDFVFINFLTPRMQASTLVDYTTKNLACRRFAVLYPDESYGRTFLHRFWDQLIENNARLVAAESYNPEHTDFAEPIKRLVGLHYDLPEDLAPETMTRWELEDFAGKLEIFKGVLSVDPSAGLDENESFQDLESEPYDFGFGRIPEADEGEPEPIVDFDAIFIPDAPEKAGLIIPQLRYYDINEVYLLGTNLWHSEKLIDIAGYQIRDAVIPEGFFSQSRQRSVSEFVSDFTDVYEYTPGFMEAVSYDTAMILCRQISRKDVSTRPKLQQA
ncbi:MAG: ABC transporter substrate-binding protein, partial [Desulfosalsimonas sp.]